MSVRLLLRYWLRASASLPPIDLRTATLESDFLSTGEWNGSTKLESG